MRTKRLELGSYLVAIGFGKGRRVDMIMMLSCALLILRGALIDMEVSWKQGSLKHPSLSKKKKLYQSKCGCDFRISIGLLLIKLIKGVQNSRLFYSILLFLF
jgi:hypothetical protein